MAKTNKIFKALNEAALERYSVVRNEVEKAQREIASGEYVPDEKEIRDFAEREQKQTKIDVQTRRPRTKALVGLDERQIGETRDYLSIEFFEAGLHAARSVGRISRMGGAMTGTGVLVGHDVVLTNNHVLQSAAEARASEFDLDFEENRFGAAKRSRHFELDPDRFFMTHKDLDFSFVAVQPHSDIDAPLGEFGWHALIREQGKIRLGDPVNLIHHPLGQTKSVTVHNSNFLYLVETKDLSDFCWYSSDTEPGSSGAPVFNNRWEIVALHHRSIPKQRDDGLFEAVSGEPLTEDDLRRRPERAVWIANEGIRVSRIVPALEEAEFKTASQRALRDELVKLWTRANAGEVIGQEWHRGVPPLETSPPDQADLLRVHRTRRQLRIEIDLD